MGSYVVAVSYKRGTPVVLGFGILTSQVVGLHGHDGPVPFGPRLRRAAHTPPRIQSYFSLLLLGLELSDTKVYTP